MTGIIQLDGLEEAIDAGLMLVLLRLPVMSLTRI
jgi:hypothetical protein